MAKQYCTKYTAIKENCVKCAFAQWCLNDTWAILILRTMDLRVCRKCERLWWSRYVREGIVKNEAFWDSVRDKFDAVFVGTPWAPGCELMGSITKITHPRVIKECLCCAVRNPGDDFIFTEYVVTKLEDISDILGGISTARIGRQVRLLLIKSVKKKREEDKSGRNKKWWKSWRVI